MNKCLACLRPIEKEPRYHARCLKKLFDRSIVPKISFGVADLPQRISQTVGKMSISGVQMKASVKFDSRKKEIEVAAEGGTHILKPEPDEYPELPQNENLCMNIAERIGMDVPPQGLFVMRDKKWSYLVRRFDRLPDGRKLHKEDMAQILEKSSEQKYQGSLEQVGKAIFKYTTRPYLDLLNFFERVLTCFLLGNGDMHLKNWALLTTLEKEVRLAPCYDWVSSALYLPEEDESALTLNGKRNRLKQSDFFALASALQLDPKAAENSWKKIMEHKPEILRLADDSLLSREMKGKLAKLVGSRFTLLAR